MFKSILQFAQTVDREFTGLPDVDATSSNIQDGLAVLFGVFAAIAVLIIITAAIDFASGGDNPEKISKAKNTIIYALIGLVICLSAEAIIYTVLDRL